MYPMIAEITGTTVVSIVAICALVVVVGIVLLRTLNVEWEVPGFLRFLLSGTKEKTDRPTAGAKATDIETGGKVDVDAEGGPAAAERVKADGDVSVRSTAAGEGGDSKKG